ncbi:MAG: MBL fold metallo-hydrolase [Myxococcota bacterium]|nr:MBL fold metallo-hydrolase [Myxococcota bacterium]
MSARSGPVLRRSPVLALPRLHQLVLPTPWEVGPVQIYAVEGDPLTLIDTGVMTPPSWAALGAGLEAIGASPGEVKRVVLTHYHTDHMGQVQSLRDAGADLELAVHEDDADAVEGYTPARDERIDTTNALFREHGVPDALLARQGERLRRMVADEPPLACATRVDRRLRDGDRVSFKDFELEVIHGAGHTAGHLLLHEEASGALLTGDHLMGHSVPFTESYYLEGAPDPADPLARRPRFRGLPAYLRSLRRLRGGSFRTILPAHGGIVARPARAIDEALLFYEVRVQRVERAARKLAAARGAATAWEIWQAVFPKADPLTQMRTRMLMVIGALDVLEEAGVFEMRRREDEVLEARPQSSASSR